MNQVKICAIIVTYNIGKVFLENFNATKAQVDEVIIIDNNSTSPTKAMLSNLENQAKIIHLKANKGLAYAQNIGIEFVINNNYKWALFLDHDSKIAPNMVYNLLESYNKFQDPAIRLLAPNIVEQNIEHQTKYFQLINPYKFVRKSLTNEEYINPLFVINSGSLIYVDTFREIGFFREDFFIDYIDIEFCLRLHKAGMKILLAKKAEIYHKLGDKTLHHFLGKKVITTNHNSLRRYYIFRNRSYLWRRYFTKMPAYIVFDLTASINDIVKIILFEKQKLTKLKNIIKGLSDSINFFKGL